jgi:predicted AAA+ superfamily ATPase
MLEFNYLKESNLWWENSHWHEKDFHLSNIEKQKVKWDYNIISSFDEGIFSLRGPRQVGKTSWIKMRIRELATSANPKNIFFYACDNLNKDELEQAIRLFIDFADTGKKYLFLDEIPFVKDWEMAIKHLYDLGKLKDCFVLLCGSNSLDIKRSVERLPGRGDKGKRHFILYPLKFDEYIKARAMDINLTGKIEKDEALLKVYQAELAKLYGEYLLTGGFLRIINEYMETKTISESAYDIYIKWIIGDLAKYNLKEKYAKQVVRRVLETYTSEVSWSTLRAGTDIDTHNTASKYAEALEEMFILEIIYKMEFNKKVPDYPRSKKIYFSDPFILAACQRWVNSSEGYFEKCKAYAAEHADIISEGVILNHIIRMLTEKTKSDLFHYSDVIFYWKNKAKTKEIDFVYNDKAIELKYQSSINPEDYKGIREFKKGYLATKNQFAKDTYPIAPFLLMLKRILDE